MASIDLLHWFRRTGALPTLLLHGFTGSAASWGPVVERMTARCVAGLHLPGHHRAAPVAASWDANIDWIAATLAAEGVSACRLVGYSLGARAALGLMARHPALVSEAILVGVHPGLESDAARAERRAADAAWSALLRDRGIEAFVERWEALPIFATQSPAARAAQRRIRLAHDPLGLAASLDHMGLGQMPDYRPRLLTNATPTTLVVGERDEKFSRLATALVDAPLRIPECGHNPLVENPAAVAEVLNEAQ